MRVVALFLSIGKRKRGTETGHVIAIPIPFVMLERSISLLFFCSTERKTETGKKAKAPATKHERAIYFPNKFWEIWFRRYGCSVFIIHTV